ncbi:hypothetical protein GEMRC1_000026 [Eukaryota sp. GEM-RC1]
MFGNIIVKDDETLINDISITANEISHPAFTIDSEYIDLLNAKINDIILNDYINDFNFDRIHIGDYEIWKNDTGLEMTNLKLEKLLIGNSNIYYLDEALKITSNLNVRNVLNVSIDGASLTKPLSILTTSYDTDYVETLENKIYWDKLVQNGDDEMLLGETIYTDKKIGNVDIENIIQEGDNAKFNSVNIGPTTFNADKFSIKRIIDEEEIIDDFLYDYIPQTNKENVWIKDQTFDEIKVETINGIDADDFGGNRLLTQENTWTKEQTFSEIDVNKINGIDAEDFGGNQLLKQENTWVKTQTFPDIKLKVDELEGAIGINSKGFAFDKPIIKGDTLYGDGTIELTKIDEDDEEYIDTIELDQIVQNGDESIILGETEYKEGEIARLDGENEFTEPQTFNEILLKETDEDSEELTSSIKRHKGELFLNDPLNLNGTSYSKDLIKTKNRTISINDIFQNNDPSLMVNNKLFNGFGVSDITLGTFSLVEIVEDNIAELIRVGDNWVMRGGTLNKFYINRDPFAPIKIDRSFKIDIYQNYLFQYDNDFGFVVDLSIENPPYKKITGEFHKAWIVPFTGYDYALILKSFGGIKILKVLGDVINEEPINDDITDVHVADRVYLRNGNDFYILDEGPSELDSTNDFIYLNNGKFLSGSKVGTYDELKANGGEEYDHSIVDPEKIIVRDDYWYVKYESSAFMYKEEDKDVGSGIELAERHVHHNFGFYNNELIALDYYAPFKVAGEVEISNLWTIRYQEGGSLLFTFRKYSDDRKMLATLYNLNTGKHYHMQFDENVIDIFVDLFEHYLYLKISDYLEKYKMEISSNGIQLEFKRIININAIQGYNKELEFVLINEFNEYFVHEAGYFVKKYDLPDSIIYVGGDRYIRQSGSYLYYGNIHEINNPEMPFVTNKFSHEIFDAWEYENHLYLKLSDGIYKYTFSNSVAVPFYVYDEMNFRFKVNGVFEALGTTYGSNAINLFDKNIQLSNIVQNGDASITLGTTTYAEGNIAKLGSANTYDKIQTFNGINTTTLNGINPSKFIRSDIEETQIIDNLWVTQLNGEPLSTYMPTNIINEENIWTKNQIFDNIGVNEISFPIHTFPEPTYTKKII